MYGIHANGIDNGQQKRSDDHDDGGSFEEGAQNEQHDEDERHDDDLARGDAHDGIEHGGGKVVVHHDLAECRGGGHHEEDGGVDAYGALDDLEEQLPRHGTGDEHFHEQGVDHGDGAGFGGGGDAAVDAAKNDDGHHDGPLGFVQGLHHFREFGTGHGFAVLPAHADDVAHQHEGAAHEDAGNDGGHEEVADGNAGGGAEKDERDARRDHDAETAGGGVHGGGELLGVAFLLHGGDHDAAHGGHGGGGGAAQRAVEEAGEDGDVGHAPLDVADQTAGNGQQGVGDGAFLHDVASHDEEGDGQQGEGVQRTVHFLCEEHGGKAAHHHAHEDGGADGNADGYGEDKQDDEGAECGKKNRIHIISFYYAMLNVLRYLIDTAQNGLDTHEAEACGHGHPDDPGRQLHGGGELFAPVDVDDGLHAGIDHDDAEREAHDAGEALDVLLHAGAGKVGKDGKLEVRVGAHGETASEKHAPDDEVTGQLFRPG